MSLDPARWAIDGQRVTVAALSQRGTVTAHHPEAVTVDLDDGTQTQVPVTQVTALPAGADETDADAALTAAARAGGTDGPKLRAALAAAGFELTRRPNRPGRPDRPTRPPR